MKKIYVKDVPNYIGKEFTDFFLCSGKTVATAKNGKDYLTLSFEDKTGKIDAKCWDYLTKSEVKDFNQGDVVFVTGSASLYNGAPQMSVSAIEVAATDAFDPSDLFPVSDRDLDEMTMELWELIDSVKDNFYHTLLTNIFSSERVASMFIRHTAAKSVHHGFVGGLPEHTISVARMCEKCCTHYPMLNHDLLVTGALLHDIGKLREISNFPEHEYTDEGNLLGHIIIGVQMISEEIARIEGFPESMKTELLHLIVSHHGELEWGSPKKPALIEAVALSFMDNLDAKMETMKELFASGTPDPRGYFGSNKILGTNPRKTVGGVDE